MAYNLEMINMIKISMMMKKKRSIQKTKKVEFQKSLNPKSLVKLKEEL
jgi:hypothetical protein